MMEEQVGLGLAWARWYERQCRVWDGIEIAAQH